MRIGLFDGILMAFPAEEVFVLITDTLDAIATDLRQLADEVAGNESRPPATDIVDRVRHAALRLDRLAPAAAALTAAASPVTPEPNDDEEFDLTKTRLPPRRLRS